MARRFPACQVDPGRVRSKPRLLEHGERAEKQCQDLQCQLGGLCRHSRSVRHSVENRRHKTRLPLAFGWLGERTSEDSWRHRSLPKDTSHFCADHASVSTHGTGRAVSKLSSIPAHTIQTPDSMIFPHGAEEIEQRLIDFYQFSDLSKDYKTRQALLDSCRLNFDGKVGCPAKVTELTAETWVAAAQIYLYCRFFR